MDNNEINYKIIRKIQQMEEKSPVLTKIDYKFYKNLSDYIEKLNNRLKKESSSQKEMLLKDEIHNTKKIIKDIYEHREKKILLAAITKARGGNPPITNLIDTEKNLFETILKIMSKSREKNLKNKSENKKEKNNDETNKDIQRIEKQDNRNQIVLITKEIPEFIGTDTKKYNLKVGDIISLNHDMSDMLLKRNVVKKIKKQ